MFLHLSSLFNVSLWPTLSWRVFSSLFLNYQNLLNLWLSTWSELALILAFTAAVKIFFSSFMSSMSLWGSGGNQEPTRSPRKVPRSPTATSPLSPEPWQLTEQPHAPSRRGPCSSAVLWAFPPLFSPHSSPQQSSWSSQSISLQWCPCSLLASTSIPCPHELQALLPLPAPPHLSRESSADADVSSVHCTFCLSDQFPTLVTALLCPLTGDNSVQLPPLSVCWLCNPRPEAFQVVLTPK